MKNKKEITLTIPQVKSFLRCPRCFWDKKHGESNVVYARSGSDRHQLARFRYAYFNPDNLQREIVQSVCRYGKSTGIPDTIAQLSLSELIALTRPRTFFDAEINAFLRGHPADCFRQTARTSYVPIVWQIGGMFRDLSPEIKLEAEACGLLLEKGGGKLPVRLGGVMQMIPEGPREEWSYKLHLFRISPGHAYDLFREAVRTLRRTKPPGHADRCTLRAKKSAPGKKR